MENTYYVPQDGRNDLGVMGHLLRCPKCGKKIVLEIALNGTNHNVSVVFACADCFVMDEKFKESRPEIAQQIIEQVEKFKAESSE